MATFTRNAWATGDTITADGLNYGKGSPMITIEYDDWDDEKGGVVVNVDTGATDMTAEELIDLVMKYEASHTTFEYYRPTRVTHALPGEGEDETEGIKLEFGNTDCGLLWYYPGTGHIQTLLQ